MAKPFDIPKRLVWEAWKQVKRNGGAAGVDKQSIDDFEVDLANNLYKVWNRMCSGSYFPPPVRTVEIPKKTGGMRPLGIPTVGDRVAQTAVKMHLEPTLDPRFHADSYGYRPNRSALDAIEQTRLRCWEYPFVVEFDIRAFFDNIDHDLMMRALRTHCSDKWVLVYVERWLKAPSVNKEGQQIARTKGTPQGGVVSPLLANLFLHYAFDKWADRTFNDVPFCRYADDALLHCKTESQAELVMIKLTKRLKAVGLEIHPDKSKIVYCRKNNRTKPYPRVSFTFLGYTFKPRLVRKLDGELFMSFTPGISHGAAKKLRQTIRKWKLQLKASQSIDELAKWINPIIRGWINYYGKYTKSAMNHVWWHLNKALMRWAGRKYLSLKGRSLRTGRWLGRIAASRPKLFAHWELGLRPKAG